MCDSFFLPRLMEDFFQEESETKTSQNGLPTPILFQFGSLFSTTCSFAIEDLLISVGVEACSFRGLLSLFFGECRSYKKFGNRWLLV